MNMNEGMSSLSMLRSSFEDVTLSSTLAFEICEGRLKKNVEAVLVYRRRTSSHFFAASNARSIAPHRLCMNCVTLCVLRRIIANDPLFLWVGIDDLRDQSHR